MEVERFSGEDAAFYRLVELIPIPLLVSETIGINDKGEDVIIHRLVNQRFVDVIGYTLDDLPDIAAWFELAYPDPEYRSVVFREWYQGVEDAKAAGKKTYSYRAKIRCKDGVDRWVDVIGEVSGTVKDHLNIVAFVEMTQLYETMAQLEKLTHTDLLTDILNRRGMLAQFEQECSRAKRTQRSFSITLCDIDHFKQVNDTYGHDCGDFVITQVASIIKTSVRETDFVARWGGEEFCLLMPETDVDGAAVLVGRIRENMSTANLSWHGFFLSVSLTFGIAWHAIDDSLDETLKQADIALYRGKTGGRDCVVVYQDEHLV